MAIIICAVLILRAEGRRWWCACGQFYIWAGDIWTSHNSQHLFDPYAFTHILHGFLFCALLASVLPIVPKIWRFLLTLAVEAGWEIIENSDFVINRYRETTAALGYQGDTIANSLGDIAACGLGFIMSSRLGWRRSVVFFFLVEVLLIVWIRDSLLLNIIMLVFPVQAIKNWQTGH